MPYHFNFFPRPRQRYVKPNDLSGITFCALSELLLKPHEPFSFSEFRLFRISPPRHRRMPIESVFEADEFSQERVIARVGVAAALLEDTVKLALWLRNGGDNLCGSPEETGRPQPRPRDRDQAGSSARPPSGEIRETLANHRATGKCLNPLVGLHDRTRSLLFGTTGRRSPDNESTAARSA